MDACGRPPEARRPKGGTPVIQLDVLSVSKYNASEDYVLILREHDGQRLLPIVIGEPEAHAIARAANGLYQARPSTHDLLASVISRLGAHLERIVIHDLRDETFFCQLELKGERGLLEIDCRTSDGVAVALRTTSPIFATEEVFGQAAVLPGSGQADAEPNA